MVRKKSRSRTKLALVLSMTGLSFHPAKVKADGTRKGKAETRFKLSSPETRDPHAFLEFLATVGANDLSITITPDGAEPWKGHVCSAKTNLKGPKEGGEDRWSTVEAEFHCATDDPATHLDLFRCRLAMDGRDEWEAAVELEILQGDFTLLD